MNNILLIIETEFLCSILNKPENDSHLIIIFDIKKFIYKKGCLIYMPQFF